MTDLRRLLLAALAGLAPSACSNDGAETPRTEPTAGAEAPASDGGALAAAVAADHRSPENRARDRHRHPAETLAFFGIRPGMTVVELSPGGGWYTEILAPALGEDGTLVAAIPDPEGDPEAYGTRSAQAFVAKLGERPDVYGNVRPHVWSPTEQPSLGEPGSADAVLTFRSFHGWLNRGQAEAVLRAAYEVLEPGGVFGVVQHRAPEDGDLATTTGYVKESTIVALAEAAGFELDARSEINANASDTRDYAEGVWTLPPTLRLGDTDRARYEAIGESDRMTLRFVKPTP